MGIWGKCFLGMAMLAVGSAQGATLYLAIDGNDSNPGTEALPFASFAHALHQLEPGDELLVRGGRYRLVEEPSMSALTADGIRIRAYPGEAPEILGSASTAQRLWQDTGENIWRTPVDDLARDPTGMFLGDQRITHATDFSQGRDHGGRDMLTQANMWTKADDNGVGCDNDNAGCNVYLRTAGSDPNGARYELAQRSLVRVAANDVTVQGLSFFYTQPQPIFFEAAQRVRLLDNVFAHTSNGNDNSYAVRIWDSAGSLVRGNTVYDSVYWGGTSNSKGISFMVTRDGPPNIVEYNHIYDIPGRSAVGTKGGVSNLIVRYNLIEDVFIAFEVGDARCVWSSSNTDGCQSSDEEYRPAGGWEIYGNIVRNSGMGLWLPGFIEDGGNNRMYNNVFDNVETGIELGWNGTFGNVFANNIFRNNRAAIYLRSGGTTTTVADYLDQFVSNHNLFFGSTLADIHLRPNWGGGYDSGTPYSLAQFQAEFSRETDSLGSDPQFIDAANGDYHLQATSPARDAGDTVFWPSWPSVDLGAYPKPGEIFSDRFQM